MSSELVSEYTVVHAKSKAFYDRYERKEELKHQTHYCPGCGHGIVHKMLASAIDQLLTVTTVFRAAVAHGGVADWQGYYNVRHALGDETIPGFLGGRTPVDSPALYRSISAINHVDRIKTPLMLVVGEQDQPRFDDTQHFYDALIKAGSPAKLVVYKGEGHQITSVELGVKHIGQAIDFFRAAPSLPK